MANSKKYAVLHAIRYSPFAIRHSPFATHSIDNQQRLAVFDRLAVLDEDFDDLAGARGGDLVHRRRKASTRRRFASGILSRSTGWVTVRP